MSRVYLVEILVRPVSVEGIIDDHALSRSYDLGFGFIATLSRPPPHPLPVSKLNRRHTGSLRKRDNLLPGEGKKGVGKEPNHTTARKPGPLRIIQYSLGQTIPHSPDLAPADFFLFPK